VQLSKLPSPRTAFASVLADRIEKLPEASVGIPASALPALRSPVPPSDDAEAAIKGMEILPSILRKLLRATEAQIPQLHSGGNITEAESLAALVPPVVAACTASQYLDPALARLMCAHHILFSGRRFHRFREQCTLADLPWVIQISVFRDFGRAAPVATAAFKRLAAVALAAFPATMIPNKLISQFKHLAAVAWPEAPPPPLLKDLSADAYGGSFNWKFAASARAAATLLSGSVYERYYNFSYDTILAVLPEDRARPLQVPEMYNICWALQLAVAIGSGQPDSPNGAGSTHAQRVPRALCGE
jgi:hypothetical protein